MKNIADLHSDIFFNSSKTPIVNIRNGLKVFFSSFLDQKILGKMQRLNRLFYFHELSRIRTYIRNLEGFCPDPLDDEPLCRIDWNQTS